MKGASFFFVSLLVFWREGSALGLFSNLKRTKALVKILILGQREEAPAGVSFLTSV